ncbi:gas vesicle protein [Leptolyngbya sp. Heron Island J]|uniref:YtxH domain-containing protein n=1 Tax=Leptolyngbya sp. Heron Island J TaxID=1385935 RepID=UPI0003B9EB33|nr:YtxH domain-containing protein [Leptolyngbya sp. Heron Island J]ESA34486.1 gas vesicle protein [Leptolyngbya sp. Heron Island J]
MSQNRSDNFITGLVAGTALGTVLGILIAPRSGKHTRKVLKKSADAVPDMIEDLSTSLQFHADRLSHTTLQNWDSTLERLKEALIAGQAASQADFAKTATESQRD